MEDNGGGIPLEIQGRIFAAGFTTKPFGEGTGLGLTISREIVEDSHRGRSNFESEPGKGTTFHVRIPIERKQRSDNLANSSDNGQPRVVIVDDEEMVITSIRAFLQMETEYAVHGFTKPEEAVKYLETTPVDVVVSDYLMPKMNGIQLLAKAKQLQPEAARVLLTGHADKQSAIVAINDVLLVIQSAIERTQLFRTLQQKVSELDEAHSSLKDVQSRLLRAFL